MCFNVKSSTYYFHVKAKVLAHFQICISAPLNASFLSSNMKLLQIHIFILQAQLHRLLIWCFFAHSNSVNVTQNIPLNSSYVT